MGLETASYLSDLVLTNPTGGDPIQQGDDHLRLIKKVITQTFPGAGGLGFASPITATEAELNFVDGVTSSIQTQINTLNLIVPDEQVQTHTRFTAGGTADAITGTLSPAITAYVAGLRVSTTPAGVNTITAPTLNLNALGTKTIKRVTGGSKAALSIGDYSSGGPFIFEYDGTDFILLNPSSPIGLGTPVATTSGTAIDFTGIPAISRGTL